MITRSYIFRGAEGFHVRPATRFSKLAKDFAGQVTIVYNGESFDGKSPMEIMSACIEDGARFSLRIEGEDEKTLVRTVREQMSEGGERCFEELPGGEEASPLPPPAAESKRNDAEEREAQPRGGLGASPGLALGRAFVFSPEPPSADPQESPDQPGELARLNEAAAGVAGELRAMLDRLDEETKKELIGAHLALLEDERFLGRSRERIDRLRCGAEYAVLAALEELEEEYGALGNERMRLRLADLRDLCYRLYEKLTGKSLRLESVPPDSILVARDLLPSDTVSLEPSAVRGFIVEEGGASSHTAILARSMGIPAIVGARGVLSRVSGGDLVLMDGERGSYQVNPDVAAVEGYREKLRERQEKEALLDRFRRADTVTRDGTRLRLMANLFSGRDAAEAVRQGAEGVGLFRTEFLYMNRAFPPSAGEQYQIYAEVLDTLDGRPCTIRTLDAGGDKPIACLTLPKESNPFLGVRGIRYSLRQEEVFRQQLRALLMASARGPLRIMLPMVTLTEEVRRTRELLRQEEAELRREGVPMGRYELGVMIETPAAALISRSLAGLVDFMSVGSNDLTQYAMAADRGNPALGELASPCHPAVLRLIRMAGEAAGEAGIPLSVCGESAADPLLAPLYAAMGVRSLSLSAPGIPKLRSEIHRMDLSARPIDVDVVTGLSTANEVKEALRRYAGEANQ